MKHKDRTKAVFFKKTKTNKKQENHLTLHITFFWGDFAVEIVLKLPSIIEKD